MRHAVSNGIWFGAPLLAAMLMPGPASACSQRIERLSADQVRSRASAAFAEADVVIDAIVADPMVNVAGATPTAALRVERSFKGSLKPGDLVPVLSVTSCHITLDRRGEHVRILMQGGWNGLYVARSGLQGVATEGENDQKLFNGEIDRLSGAVRGSDYSAFPGASMLASTAEAGSQPGTSP